MNRLSIKVAHMAPAIVVAVIVATFAKLNAVDGPIVATREGSVQGIPGPVVAFKGIPFAQPPVGNLRWKPPAPAVAWKDVRPATEFGPACLQTGDRRKSEDCLYLNVWAPASALERGKNFRALPVMIWTFGGSFTNGSGDIDGSALAGKGVIVVSFNYRVGTFGFLAHPQLSAESPQRASGNYGLMDAIAALRWVRENIRQFGGDPSRVTLWGVSAGASVITALMVSPVARGSFHQVILESPGAMRHWKSLREAEEQGLSVGRDVAALRKLPASEIPLIQNLGGGAEIRSLFEPRVIGPVLDGHVLKEEEREAFEAGRVNLRAVLVGNNTDEGAVFTQAYPVKTMAAYREYLNNPKVFGKFGSEALSHYPVSADADVPRAIADSFGDSQFYFGARGIARSMIAKTRHVYRYRFVRKSNGGAGHDAWHAAEVPYVMGNVSGAEYNHDDRTLSTLMMDAWVRFVSTGNPNGGAVTNWPAFEAASDPYLVLDVHPVVAHGLRNSQLDFIGTVQRATRK
jgi:para-nitrobenzyl esterase